MIFIQITEQLKSLSSLLLLLNDRQYNQKIAHLGDASIGGHTRHIIELLKCVANGYNAGTVDYFNRERNLMIETDKSIAINEINILSDKLLQPDKQMKLLVDDADNISPLYVTTTYFREVVYNGEHAIHHLALIRVALREMKLTIVEDDFGMAYSTIQYLASQTAIQNGLR
jgi:hypothetical protein